MKPLWMKLGRDIKTNLAQFIAVVFIITLGSAFFIASFSSYQGVNDSLEKTYQELKFPQYWIKLGGDGPVNLPVGVEMRETAQVVLEFNPGERAGAKIIGLQPEGPLYSRLKLSSGALPGEGQVLVEESFARFHKLKPGDTLGIRVGEKVYNWVVSGTAGSPEFIWPVLDRFVPNSSPRNFGVLYAPQNQLLRDVTGLSHELLVYGADLRQVMTALQSQKIKISEVYSRNEQPSHQVLNLLLKGFSKLAGLLPWLFLLAACLASFALISLLLKSQLGQIKILKYLGFSRWQILSHYLTFSLLAGVLGSLLGCLLGIYLAGKLTGALAGIIGLPFVVTHVRHDVLLTAGIFNCLAALLGGLLPALSAGSGVERTVKPVPAWHRFVPVMVRIPLNNVLREGRNSLFTLVTVALGVCLVVVGFLLYDSVAESARKQFESYQAYDLRAQFRSTLKEDVSAEISRIPGVMGVNPFYELPVIVQMGNWQVPTSLLGARGDMLKLEDRLGRPVELTGLFMSDRVKESLAARWTPEVALTTLGGRKTELAVKGYVRWHFGNQIFAPLELVQSLSGKKGITGVFLRVQPGELEQVRSRLYRYPTIMQVDSPQETYEDQKTLVNFTYVYLRILTLFGLILAAAMIFSTASVAVLSRSREYVTMRVLGLGYGQIGLGVFAEYLFLVCVGLGAGILAGIGLAFYLLGRVNTALVYNVLTINPRTLLVIALLSIAILPAAVLSSLLSISKLNLTESSRERNG